MKEKLSLFISRAAIHPPVLKLLNHCSKSSTVADKRVAYKKIVHMKFVCNMSTQDNVTIISFKNITCCAVLFTYTILSTYRVIRNKINIFIFMGNPFPW